MSSRPERSRRLNSTKEIMTDSGFSRRQAMAALGAGTAGLALQSCTRPLAAPLLPATPLSETEGQALLDAIGEWLLRVKPEQATSLGLDNGARAPLRSLLDNRSAAGQAQIAAVVREDLARAEAADISALSHATKTSIQVIRSAYRTALEGFALPYGDITVGGWRNTPYVVIQNTGAYLDIPRFLDSDHPIRDAADADAYLERLASFPTQLDGELGRLKAAGALGVTAPAFLIDTATSQLAASVKSAHDGGGLVESIARRTRQIPGNWAARAKAIASQQVAPALQRQLEELRAQRSRATNDAGMWARPGGDAFYRWALKASTTTTLSPDEIHAIGLEQVASLNAQMDVILRGLGYTKGSVGARMLALNDDPRFQFADNDSGRAEIMAFIKNRIDRIRAKMPQAFATLVRANLEVRRLPPEEEPGAPVAYGGAGSIDGSIPGKMWINLGNIKLHNRFGLPTLVHHETIPGHIWQGEYARQMPTIRTMLEFNAYSEGWALYAEQLGDELGSYDGEPVGRLGYLQSIAFRACRLVVDTGLHAKRWTRAQAIQWFHETNGSSIDEVSNEVDRYCSWPGQACGYKVGMNEINRQRDKAKAALGARYDLRTFDDAVVKGGNVPLDVLAKNIDDYVATARG
jgi:uncharacterized protein (DUF885 family)